MSAALEQLQAQFAAGILGGERGILAALRPGAGLDAGERLGVYREAYRARLVDALADSFGHTLRYLGEDAFRALALAYVETHVPAASSIRWYGATLPAWLRRACGDDGALAELAGLDWALRAAFDSLDAEPLGAEALTTLSAADWDRVGFRLHPSLRLLALRWNAVARWQALDRESAPPGAALLAQPCVVAVWRKGLDPHFRTLDPGEDRALRALRRGARFAALCARLAQSAAPEDAALRAAHWLRRWFEEGLLVGLR